MADANNVNIQSEQIAVAETFAKKKPANVLVVQDVRQLDGMVLEKDGKQLQVVLPGISKDQESKLNLDFYGIKHTSYRGLDDKFELIQNDKDALKNLYIQTEIMKDYSQKLEIDAKRVLEKQHFALVPSNLALVDGKYHFYRDMNYNIPQVYHLWQGKAKKLGSNFRAVLPYLDKNQINASPEQKAYAERIVANLNDISKLRIMGNEFNQQMESRVTSTEIESVFGKTEMGQAEKPLNMDTMAPTKENSPDNIRFYNFQKQVDEINKAIQKSKVDMRAYAQRTGMLEGNTDKYTVVLARKDGNPLTGHRVVKRITNVDRGVDVLKAMNEAANETKDPALRSEYKNVVKTAFADLALLDRMENLHRKTMMQEAQMSRAMENSMESKVTNDRQQQQKVHLGLKVDPRTQDRGGRE